MIKYETENSQFYLSNEDYCTQIEQQLGSINANWSGFCNAFGYEIYADFKKETLACHVKFEKHQTTQNGIVLPINAHNYAGIELSVKGLATTQSITIGKSSALRLITEKKFKNILPSPYYMRFRLLPDMAFVQDLAGIFLENEIAALNLKNGVLVCKMHSPAENIFELIEGIVTMIILNQ